MARLTLNNSRLAAIDAALDAESAVASANAWFASQIAAGFESTGGIRLGLTTEDVTLLTGNYVLAKECAALDLDIPPVVDANGTPHSLTIEALTNLMLEYGQHRAALSAEYVTRRSGTPE